MFLHHQVHGAIQAFPLDCSYDIGQEERLVLSASLHQQWRSYLCFLLPRPGEQLEEVEAAHGTLYVVAAARLFVDRKLSAGR